MKEIYITSAQRTAVGSLNKSLKGIPAFEWSETKGLPVKFITSDLNSSGTEFIYHTDESGYVYQHDTGNSFDGSNVEAEFQTPDMDYGDNGLRKSLYAVKANIRPEGVQNDLNLRIRYDFESSEVPQPGNFAVGNLSSASFYNPFAGVSEGTLVNPGTYTIDMSIIKAGETTKVVDPQSFNVVALNNTVMPADDRESKVNFQRKVSKLQAEMGEYSRKFSEISNKIPYIDEAIKKVEQPVDKISKMAWDVKQSIKEVNLKFYGDNVKSRLDIQSYLSPYSRLGSVAYYQKYSTAAPTKTHMDSYEIAKEEFQPIKLMIDELKLKMTDLEKQLKDMGAAYTPGRPKAIN